MFEAFEAPIGARDTDRTWRGMVARARREYLTSLMPIWAAVLTLASMVLGLPGLYLLGQATGLTDNQSIQIALQRGPLAGSLETVTPWIAPLGAVLSPTSLRFGLEAFAVGAVLLFGLAWLVRAAGSRQWYQSVYDDIPSRRVLLTLLLWVALPGLVAFLLSFFGALVEAVVGSPAVASLMVAVVSVVVLGVALMMVYLTFSVREPAIPAVMAGAGLAAVALFAAALVLDALPGLRTIAEAETSPLRALLSLSVFFFVFWSIVLAGSQLAVAMAHRHNPITQFTSASRGEQLDFSLSLIRDIEDQTRARRWARIEDLAAALGAPTAMVTFALDRLRRGGIVEHADDGSRPPRRWAIKSDLEMLTLHDLSRAMGTNLDPVPGLHARSSEEVIQELAEREHLGQTQNLLSIFRGEPDLAPVGEPMLAVETADYALGESDPFAASMIFEPVAQVVDRETGDNGGPADGDASYVFVDGVVDEAMVLDTHAGPSALLAPEDSGDEVPGVALDLTQSMRLASEDDDSDTAPEMAYEVPAPIALELGEASPLARVRDEIDHLLDGGFIEAPQTGPVAAHASWRANRTPPRAFIVAGDPAYIDPVGSWRGKRAPVRDPQIDRAEAALLAAEKAEEEAEAEAQTAPAPDLEAAATREWHLPLPARRSWRRESSRLTPKQSWKHGGEPFAPPTRPIEPIHRVTFGSKLEG